MTIRVAVIGAGSWGTTVAHIAAHNTPTILWARQDDLAKEIDAEHRNSRYLAEYKLHESLRATSALDECVASADLLVMGVPSHGFRDTLEQVADHVRPWVPVVSLTKGLEQGTKFRMSQVVHEVLPGHPVGVLTGPNLAKEILAGQAAAAVVAMADEFIASELQGIFATDLFRVYVNRDVIGSELGGVLKNVIAIAAGMADGTGAGDNTRAAVMTRGLAEITRLGVAMGGDPHTFAGLAGMGDLLATCMSPQSRNRYVGEQLGKGHSIDEIIAEMNQVAEGVKSCRTVLELANEHDVDMPIVTEVVGVVHGGRRAIDAYRGLLARKATHERNPG
ncbi:MAG TPA: NAD(P)H-dependent glycerol-3-phosphate dehydrogenase [Acidimicrobiales bacterium]|jgi:glycerol-3-phosphate dehydrogenase (NAD(P)+)|nr:NAD(P)H-dependent glycerol-3-phosphate dehydrogenase [Acidimicrobiales bacterium]